MRRPRLPFEEDLMRRTHRKNHAVADGEGAIGRYRLGSRLVVLRDVVAELIRQGLVDQRLRHRRDARKRLRMQQRLAGLQLFAIDRGDEMRRKVERLIGAVGGYGNGGRAREEKNVPALHGSLFGFCTVEKCGLVNFSGFRTSSSCSRVINFLSSTRSNTFLSV